MSLRIPRYALVTLGLVLVLVLAGAETAVAGVRVELPLGPVVRAGRPLVVRVADAERVRAPGAPWALPQGVRGDEFVLQGARPVGGELTIEVRAAGADHEVTVAVRELPADGRVTAVLDDSELGGGDVRVLQTRLPTVREAWLLFDDVRGSFGGASGAVSSALASWRARRPARAAGRALEPLLLPPSMGAYRAATEAGQDAPALPADVAAVLLLLAATEALLVLLVRRAPLTSSGAMGAAARAAWLAAPPLAALLWLLAGPGPPRALRATVVVLSAAEVETGGESRAGERMALLLVEGRRAGEARFELPEGAGPAALVRFAADDGSERGVATGGAVEVRLGAGESRLFAYRLQARSGAVGGPGGNAKQPPRREMARWLRSLGWVASPAAAEDAFEGALPEAEGARAIRSAALGLERLE